MGFALKTFQILAKIVQLLAKKLLGPAAQRPVDAAGKGAGGGKGKGGGGRDKGWGKETDAGKGDGKGQGEGKRRGGGAGKSDGKGDGKGIGDEEGDRKGHGNNDGKGMGEGKNDGKGVRKRDGKGRGEGKGKWSFTDSPPAMSPRGGAAAAVPTTPPSTPPPECSINALAATLESLENLESISAEKEQVQRNITICLAHSNVLCDAMLTALNNGPMAGSRICAIPSVRSAMAACRAGRAGQRHYPIGIAAHVLSDPRHQWSRRVYAAAAFLRAVFAYTGRAPLTYTAASAAPLHACQVDDDLVNTLTHDGVRRSQSLCEMAHKLLLRALLREADVVVVPPTSQHPP